MFSRHMHYAMSITIQESTKKSEKSFAISFYGAPFSLLASSLLSNDIDL